MVNLRDLVGQTLAVTGHDEDNGMVLALHLEDINTGKTYSIYPQYDDSELMCVEVEDESTDEDLEEIFMGGFIVDFFEEPDTFEDGAGI